MITSIISIIAGILADVPIFDKWVQSGISAYQARKATKLQAQGDDALAPLENPNQKATDAQKQASMAALDNLSANE